MKTKTKKYTKPNSIMSVEIEGITDKQLTLITSLGVSAEEAGKMTKQQASQTITQLLDNPPITDKQWNFIINNSRLIPHLSVNELKNINRRQATKLISEMLNKVKAKKNDNDDNDGSPF